MVDQGRDMMAVKDIVYGHKITLIGPYTSIQGVFQGPLYYYLLSVPTLVFNGDPWGSVLLMLVISLSVVVISSFWMYKLFGLKAGVITMVFFALSTQAITAATFAWNPHPMWFLITVFILSFLELNLGRKKFALVMWPTIAIMFHFQMAFGVFAALSAVLYFLLFKRKLLISNTSFLGILIAGIFFIPQAVFELRHNFLMVRAVIDIFKGDSGVSANTSYFNLILDHVNIHLILFKSAFIKERFLNSLPEILFLITIASAIYLKIKNKFTKKELSSLKILLTLFILFLAFTIFHPFLIRAWFLTGFEVFYLLIFSLVFSRFVDRKIGKFLIIVLFSLMFLYSAFRINEVYRSDDLGGVSKIHGKQEALEFIHNSAKGEDYNLLIFTPPVNTFHYDYLIWFNNNRHGWPVPEKEKSGLTYLLIEPDPGKPWTYKGWLETVIKSGKVLEEVKLPSGLIIQKRLFD